MYKAKKRGLRKKISQCLIYWMLRRQFAGIHVRGICVQLVANPQPTIYVANHVALWDGGLASYLTHTFCKQDPFLMTAEQAMNPLFTWGGAFGVNQSDPISAARSVHYAVGLLQKVPRCGLWVFPQGLIYPFSRRPLGFQPGVAYIAKRVNNVLLVPVTFYYSFAVNLRPEAFVSFGEPFSPSELSADPNVLTRQIEAHVAHNMDQLESDLVNAHLNEFQTILRGSRDFQYYVLSIMRKPHPPLKTWGLKGSDYTAQRICQGDTQRDAKTA
jgi:1-acyl-sn-glycerol-3-phosphate acyltransferase